MSLNKFNTQNMKNGTTISETGKGKVMVGNFEGIKFEVHIGPKSGGGQQVNSGYPSWNQ
jgi:hypothetical protein